MNQDQYSEAYRLCAGITRPINRDRVYQLARVLSFSSLIPEPVIPNSQILEMIGDANADPLEARVTLAIDWGIKAKLIRRDPTNPQILLPI